MKANKAITTVGNSGGNIDSVLLHKHIKGVFDEVAAMKNIVKTNKEPYIRPSAAPACSIRLFVEICNGIGRGGEWEQEETFNHNYYTGLGTVTHEINQKWFGATGKLLGDWSCLCRGTKKIKKTVGRTEVELEVPKVMNRMTTNSVCPKCGKTMKYEELEIDVDGLTGHVDGVLEFIIGKTKIHVVIDYKGTTADKIKSAVPTNKFQIFPDPKHVKQISLYTYALKEYYGLNIVGHALLYMSRDTPIPKYKICAHAMSGEDWDEAEKLFKSQTKQIRILYKSLADGNIARLLKHKLCTDHKYYRKYVEGRYNKCEFCDICFSAPKQMTAMLTEVAEQLESELE